MDPSNNIQLPGSKVRPIANRRHEVVTSLKSKADAQRTLADRIADRITYLMGSMPFLIANLIWFVVWITINLGLIPGVEPFEPFPFGLLTMIVSLEAIVLAIAVLISQNRAGKIADLREEIDLQVNILAERELTKVIEMMVLLLKQQGIDVPDNGDLDGMLKPTDVEGLEQIIEEQINDKGNKAST